MKLKYIITSERDQTGKLWYYPEYSKITWFYLCYCCFTYNTGEYVEVNSWFGGPCRIPIWETVKFETKEEAEQYIENDKRMHK